MGKWGGTHTVKIKPRRDCCIMLQSCTCSATQKCSINTIKYQLSYNKLQCYWSHASNVIITSLMVVLVCLNDLLYIYDSLEQSVHKTSLVVPKQQSPHLSLAFSCLVLLTVVDCNILSLLFYLACHFCDVTKHKFMLM